MKNPKFNRHKKPLLVLVAAHPICNVPPFINSSRYFSYQGFRVLLIGYQNDELSKTERISQIARIFRIGLISRRIPYKIIRQSFALVEFLIQAFLIIRKLKPNGIVLFNDPASLLLFPIKLTKESPFCISWLLEFPDFNFKSKNLLTSLLFNFSAKCWSFADLLVFPTLTRMALSYAKYPSCLNSSSIVVQNSPTTDNDLPFTLSLNTQKAITFLEEEKKNNRTTIIYSGAIGNRYGINSLIHAAAKYPDHISLLLLGKKHDLSEKEVNTAIQEAGNSENIHWIDEIPYSELQSVLRHANIGFVTYLRDSLNTFFAAPGKVYEYTKSGLIILTDVNCCIYSELDTYNCGFFFPYPATTENIETALKSIILKKEELSEMGYRSRLLFQEKLCFEKQMLPIIPFIDRLKN